MKNSFGARVWSHAYTALLPCAQKLTGPKNKPQDSSSANSISARLMARHDLRNHCRSEENLEFRKQGSAREGSLKLAIRSGVVGPQKFGSPG